MALVPYCWWKAATAIAFVARIKADHHQVSARGNSHPGWKIKIDCIRNRHVFVGKFTS
jgi:hypothetical protein